MARRNAIHEKITCKSTHAGWPLCASGSSGSAWRNDFVSGQIPIEVPSGQVFRGDIQRQTEIAMNHLKTFE